MENNTEEKQFVSCSELFKLTENETNMKLERLTLCDLCPSLTLDYKKYKKVNTVIFDNGTYLTLNRGVRERGFTLYAKVMMKIDEKTKKLVEDPEATCNEYLLYYNKKCVKEYQCPLTLNGLIAIVYDYDIDFAMFLLLGVAVRAMIKTRDAVRDAVWGAVWGAAKKAFRQTIKSIKITLKGEK